MATRYIIDIDGILLKYATGLLSWVDRLYNIGLDLTFDQNIDIVSDKSNKLFTQGGLIRAIDLDVNLDIFIAAFEETYHFGKLKALTDAKKLLEVASASGQGVFLVSSSCNTRSSADIRMKNLTDLFGTNLFDDVILLGQGACKANTIKRLLTEDTVFIDDHPMNIRDAITEGVPPENIYTLNYGQDFLSYIDRRKHFNVNETLADMIGDLNRR